MLNNCPSPLYKIQNHQDRKVFFLSKRLEFGYVIGELLCLSNIQLDILSNKLWKIGKINQSAKDRAGEALKKVKIYVK